MKKLFTLIAAALMAVSAMAQGEVDIPITSADQWTSGWGCDVTFSDGVITATNKDDSYGAAGCWLGDVDWSKYSTLTVVMESCTSGWGQIIVKDVDDKEITAGLGQTSTKKEFSCDISSLTKNVKQICIQSAPGAVYKFSRVYLSPKVAGKKKALKITMTATKTNSWDAQAFISLPQPLMTAGEEYNIKMMVKASSDFEMGSEAIDDKQTAHKTQYDGSAVYNYTAGKNVTSEFTEFVITCPGKTDLNDCNANKSGHEVGGDDHKNFAYAPSAILLNHGKLAKDGVLTISDIQLFDKDWNFVSNIDLASVAAYDNTKSVYYSAWQNAATYDIIDLPVEEVTIDEALTYSSDKILNFSELTDVEAYIATGVSGSAVTMTKVTGAVPAGTGLVLKQVGENATILIPSCATATEDVSENKLVATTAETTVSKVLGATNYVLAGTGTSLGWYSIGTTSATLAAGKAYLSIPVTAGGAKVLSLSFDGDATAIKSVEKATITNNAIYSLQGIKVATPVKGNMYIQNGKKIIF